MQTGKVFLVGAGPGDPQLITVKGAECLRRADVVIYDYLANEQLLKYCSPQVELIYVGKKASSHTLPQGDINELIARKSKEGKTVVRLKGGDPFVFGRGGEEAEILVAQKVPFEIVPGVTSAIAAPAYAGIPLTHRDFTSSAAFITGHEDPTKEESSIAWDKLATGVGTLVFLMGVSNLPNITRRLMENGRSPQTPVALVRWGSTPRQQTLVGTLQDIVQKAQVAQIKPPTVIVVGEVINLRPILNWFEAKPLFGKRVLVTRSREQASSLTASLTDYGADVVEMPTIQVVPADDYADLDAAINDLENFDWVIFSSTNGVDYFLRRLRVQYKDIRQLKGVKICAIGPATAQRLEDLHLTVDYVPNEYRAEGIIEGLKQQGIAGARVLIPRAEVAREVLPEELTRCGAQVQVVPAYKTIQPEVDWDRLQGKKIDVVTFTSSSTVTNFVNAVGEGKVKAILNGVLVASIGPITADTAKDLGIETKIMPESYTIPDLVEAIVKYFNKVE